MLANILPPPARFNFAQHLITLNATRAGKTALIDDLGTLSYSQLADQVQRFASGLVALGLRREDRVFLLMHDSSDWVVGFLGALYAGVVPVALNTLLTPEDYAFMLDNSRAQAALVSGALLPTLQTAMAQTPHELKTLVVSRPTAALPEGAIDFASATSGHAPMVKPADTLADEAAFWLYSSGSTGKPKGTVHTQGNLYWTAELYGKNVLGLRESDVVFSAAKLFFAYGLGNALTFPLSVGASVLLMAERPTPQAVFKRMTENRPTVFYGAPTGYGGMLASPDLPREVTGQPAPVLVRRRGTSARHRRALDPPFRLRDHRRHRLDRNAARLFVEPPRRRALRHHRQAGARLRDRVAQRGGRGGERRQPDRRPFRQGAQRSADVLEQPRKVA